MIRTEFREPFAFTHFEEFCSEKECGALLAWLKSLRDWDHIVVTNFFDQYERLIAIDQFAARFGRIHDRFVKTLRQVAFKQTGLHMIDDIEIVALKLVTGQGLGLHTDFKSGTKTKELYRTVMHIATDDLSGGELLFFSSRNPWDVTAVIKPISGDAMAFQISHQSFHAVGDVTKGERYTLVARGFTA